MTFLSATILLFLVLDPLGNIPVFLSVLERVPKEKRRKVILRESLIAFGVLLFFFVCGDRVMDLLSLDQPALGVAGGVILFLIAIRMVFPHSQSPYTGDNKEPLIVPLAVPLIAGPSAIATVMLFMSNEKANAFEILLSIACAWAASTVILLCSPVFNRLLGERGLSAVERLMGLILATISIQMLMNGITSFLHLHLTTGLGRG
jgi:multiple antibiotic resistance protein